MFPHERALNEGGSSALEEERRLAYVAITRAKQKLFISTAYSRNVFGQWQNNVPSRFLNEIPPQCLTVMNCTFPPQSSFASYPQKKAYGAKPVSPNKKDVRVYHPTFGYGTLVRVEADNKCEVYFDNSGRKMIYGSYLRKV